MLSVFESQNERPLIAAQWRQVLRTTSITPSLSAQKLLDRLLALRTTDVPALRQSVVDADTALVLKRVVIGKKETEINQLIYGLYGLDEAEIRQIEQG